VGRLGEGWATFRCERWDEETGVLIAATHVGVLDYGCVPEGEIGVPEAVMRALKLNVESEDADATSMMVLVSYAALPRATKMTLKPKTNAFARDFANEDVRDVLEKVMMARSTATVGDIVVAERSIGETMERYELIVAAVEPDDEGAVSLLETDVEVELATSEEYERVMEELANRERRRREEFANAKEALAEREREKLREREAFEERKRSLRASIKPEPAQPRGAPGIVTVRFSLPNGTLSTRRFRFRAIGDGNDTHSLRDVFDYVRSLDDGVLARERGSVTLATRDAPLIELKEPADDTADDIAGVPIDSALDCRSFFVR